MARLIDADALIKVAEAKKFAIADNTHPYEAIRIQGKYFREAIDDAPTVDAVPVVPGRWIPVSERLPEQGQEVIVYDGGVLKPKVFCYLFWNKDYNSWARITHWMPLPEPPKGE